VGAPHRDLGLVGMRRHAHGLTEDPAQVEGAEGAPHPDQPSGEQSRPRPARRRQPSVTVMHDLLIRTAEIAAGWLESLGLRPVAAHATVGELRARLGGPPPARPADPPAVVGGLAPAAAPGLVAIPSGRYFGFVIGGGLPAAVAADWLTSAWDQCPGLYACGPAGSVAEEVAGAWVRQLLGLPEHASFAFVTGCQMAHLTCLAAAPPHGLK